MALFSQLARGAIESFRAADRNKTKPSLEMEATHGQIYPQKILGAAHSRYFIGRTVQSSPNTTTNDEKLRGKNTYVMTYDRDIWPFDLCRNEKYKNSRLLLPRINEREIRVCDARFRIDLRRSRQNNIF